MWDEILEPLIGSNRYGVDSRDADGCSGSEQNGPGRDKRQSRRLQPRIRNCLFGGRQITALQISQFRRHYPGNVTFPEFLSRSGRCTSSYDFCHLPQSHNLPTVRQLCLAYHQLALTARKDSRPTSISPKVGHESSTGSPISNRFTLSVTPLPARICLAQGLGGRPPPAPRRRARWPL